MAAANPRLDYSAVGPDGRGHLQCALCVTGFRKLRNPEFTAGIIVLSGMTVCGQHFDIVFQNEGKTLGELGVVYQKWLEESPSDFLTKGA